MSLDTADRQGTATVDEADGSSWQRILTTLRRSWRLIALVAAVVLVVLSAILVFTPVLGVRTITVVDGDAATNSAVASAVAQFRDEPLLRVDADAVSAAALAAAPAAADVSIRRTFPGTLQVTVQMREPVMSVALGGKIQAIDADGVIYAGVVSNAVPRLTVKQSIAPVDRMALIKETAAVVGGLPPALVTQINRVQILTRDDIRFTLSKDRVVRWGSGQETARKTAVVVPLLESVKADVYDVSAPDLPTTS